MKLPVISGPEVIKALIKDGYEVIHQRGSHVKLRKEGLDGRKITIIPEKF